MDTAADAVVSVPPADDAGARTADLYDWQAAMAAADGLSLYLDTTTADGDVPSDADRRIMCERHEDWVVALGSDAELVSAKHREPASGAWTTVSQLVDQGGLGHLFGRWLALGRMPRARLVTCGALAAGAPRKLAKAITVLHKEAAGDILDQETQAVVAAEVDGFARLLLVYRKGLPTRWQAPDGAIAASVEVETTHLQEVRAFLSVLFIDDQRPNRSVVGHAAPSMYALPILARLGRLDVPPSAVWEAVLAVFRTRMRAQGPVSSGALPIVLSTRSASGNATPMSVEEQRDLASRVVTVQDIGVAIRVALAHPLGYVPITPPARLTKLSVKMARGGCADTSIERAEQLRIGYRDYWRSRRENVPGGTGARAAVERALMRAADEATTASRTATGSWGMLFWKALAEHLARISDGERPDGLDDELARGGVCELAARCHVWFSAQFDVSAEIARLRAERTVTP
ncbi:hypothetical protein [Actinophytocola sediminis]